MQLAAHDLKRRFRVLAWGRQSGKSTWGNNELIRSTWNNRNHIYWYVLPTFSQAKVQYRRAKVNLLGCPGAMTKFSDTELSITLRSGSTLFYKSGDKPENLRTETLHGVIMDEVRSHSEDTWPIIIRPMLATTGGWAAFISTTNGFDAFWELSEKARTDTTGQWGFLSASSTCNPLFTKDEYEACQRDMSEQEFRQEILAEFVELYAGKAYHNYGDANVKDANPFTGIDSYAPFLPIVVGMDFNLSPMAWILGQLSHLDSYWREEIFLKNSHTQEAARELCARVEGHKAGVVLCGDATGKAGQRAAAGQSDYDILCQELDRHGIKWFNSTPPSNPLVKDRLNAVNAKLKDATGTPHLFHHSRCTNLRRDFLRVTVKQGANFVLDAGSNNELTHISDAIGYAISALSPVPSVYQPGKMRVIVR